MSDEQILAIGDLHGMYDSLQRVLNKVVPACPNGTRLVFMGDYVDRGPSSAQVIGALLELRARRPDTVFLKGNHEQMLIKALDGQDPQTFLWNGGASTLRSYGLAPDRVADIPQPHQEFLRSLVMSFESEDHIFVHAGLRPGLPLESQSEHDLLWIREDFFLSRVDFGKTVVFGHTPFPEPFVRPGLIGIDTGAVYGNKLTCVMLPAGEFFSL